MFLPQWEYLLKPATWIWAMGQAFFSLSITGSGMIVYGAYLSDDEDDIDDEDSDDDDVDEEDSEEEPEN